MRVRVSELFEAGNQLQPHLRRRLLGVAGFDRMYEDQGHGPDGEIRAERPTVTGRPATAE